MLPCGIISFLPLYTPESPDFHIFRANGIAARKSPFKIKEGRTKQNRNAPGAPVDVAAFLSVWGVCILNRFNIDILAHNADIVKTAGRKLK